MTSSESLKQSIKAHLDRKAADAGYSGTYECAYKDLLIWRMDKEAAAEEIPRYEGLDGPHAEEVGRIAAEYRQRLNELKTQFHID